MPRLVELSVDYNDADAAIASITITMLDPLDADQFARRLIVDGILFGRRSGTIQVEHRQGYYLATADWFEVDPSADVEKIVRLMHDLPAGRSCSGSRTAGANRFDRSFRPS